MPLNTKRESHYAFRFEASGINLVRLLWLSLCLLPVVATYSPGTAASLDEVVTPGSSIARELSGGAAQTFVISLSSGQFLQLSIEKGDLNLSLSVSGPTGKKLGEVVSNSYEVLEFSLPVDSAGSHRLEIRSLEREAKRREFRLIVQPLRDTTAQDFKASLALKALAQASVRRADWTESSLRGAIDNYRTAALNWSSSGNLSKAARASMEEGEVHLTLGDYRGALKVFQKVAKDSRVNKVRLQEAEAESQIGRLNSYLGNNDEAQKDLTRALNYYEQHRIADSSPDPKRQHAEALHNMGEVYYSKGDLLKSSQHFERSAKLFSELGDRKGEARSRLFTGYIWGAFGEADRAESEFSRLLETYREVRDRTGEALSLTALGLTQSRKRNEELAIKMHHEAMSIFRVIGDRQSEAITLNAQGQAYENLRDYRLALENYQQALHLFQKNGSVDFASVTLHQIAGVYRLLEDRVQALSYYERCLSLARAAKKKRTEANALSEVAAMYASEGNREKTVRQYTRLLDFYRGNGDRRWQAIAYNNLGDFLLRLGEKEKALSLFMQALPLSEHDGEKGVKISTLYNIARATRDGGDLESAFSWIQKSIKIIEDVRGNVASPDFRSSYFAGVRKHYDLYIDILMKMDREKPGQGFAADALLASENARVRTLLETLREAGADIRQGVDPRVLQREREVEALLRSQAQYLMEVSSTEKNQTEVAEVAREVDLLRAEYQKIQAELRDRNKLNFTTRATLTLGEIQKHLGDGGNTMLLEFALGDERSYLWAVTADSIQGYELPARATLENAGIEVYELITARQTDSKQLDSTYQAKVETSDRLYLEKALGLSRMLLGPVANQLGHKRLLVVTEGVLQYIPFDALPMPSAPAAQPVESVAASSDPFQHRQPLSANHEVISLPSISTLVEIRLEQRQKSLRNNVVAILADPVFNSNDERVTPAGDQRAAASITNPGQPDQPVLRDFGGRKQLGGPTRLAHTSAEADAILAAVPGGSAAMTARGFDASRETAMSTQVAQSQILHLATHGFINTEHPELSGLVLSMVHPDGTDADGFLQIHDIYALKLSADLTVLSACDTALGKDIKGEGLVGLTRGFMHAGSRSVVASLWKVDDRATSVLMGHFYKAMLQDEMTPAAALRSAKEKIRQEKPWRAPYFWAGFVIQGEYNQPIKVEIESHWWKYAVGSFSVVLVLFGAFLLKRRRSSPPMPLVAKPNERLP